MPERLLNVSTPGDGATTTSLVGRLTNRELEVFELIGQGVGTAEIAERMHLSIKTVQTYRAHIKRKLNLTSSLALTRSAVQWTLDALLTR
jgi:DNA-binding NarL/FixJ family response regulator